MGCWRRDFNVEGERKRDTIHIMGTVHATKPLYGRRCSLGPGVGRSDPKSQSYISWHTNRWTPSSYTDCQRIFQAAHSSPKWVSLRQFGTSGLGGNKSRSERFPWKHSSALPSEFHLFWADGPPSIPLFSSLSTHAWNWAKKGFGPQWRVQFILNLRVHSSPLVRSTFCPMRIDHISRLTLYPGYWLA